MITDRELLEGAAKAMHSPENYANAPYMEGWYSQWNPLDNDGDALRLAVKLNLYVGLHHPEMLLHLSNKDFDAAIDAAIQGETK